MISHFKTVSELVTNRRESVEREAHAAVWLNSCPSLQRLILCSPNQKPQYSRGFAQR